MHPRQFQATAPPLMSRRRLLGMAAAAAGGAILAACGGSTTATRAAATATPLAATPAQTLAPASASGGATTLRASAVTGSTASGAGAACVLTPELTEGPYYIDDKLLRRDITEGKAGVPLTLRIAVVNATTCAPVPNAAVDVWHCDALGVYSGFTTASAGGPQGGPPPGGAPSGGARPGGPSGGAPPGGAPPGGGQPGGNVPTDTQTFLRGIQLTGADGVAEFATLYPGWYQGRAPHIHLKVRVGGSVNGATYAGGHTAHTGQISFADDIGDQVYQLQLYATHTGTRTRLTQDGIVHPNDGTLLALTPLTAGAVADGFVGTITFGVDPNATPTAVQ